jgi:hypothetical protein
MRERLETREERTRRFVLTRIRQRGARRRRPGRLDKRMDGRVILRQ